MKRDKKNILELSNLEAKKFMMKNSSYFSLKLPDYFKFEELLNHLSSRITGDYNGIKESDPKNLENINYVLFNNKDGKYDWRPFEIINPVIYISMLNIIFEENNWKIIRERIKKIQESSYIKCESFPLIDLEDEKIDYKTGTQINNWWNTIEQKSLELSLDYEYIFHTDIADCYNSIYTHSVPWAIHKKEVAKQNRKDSLLGNKIDRHLQAMSYGQTNGIPQGSVLMDFIAEIVLTYGDELITARIKKKGIEETSFKILRFRDDYRIFTNKSYLGEEILQIIAEELLTLGLKLHSLKTKYSNNVIQSSIKEDKINNLSLSKNNNLQKRLLLLHKFSFEYPNSGSLKKELSNLKKTIDKRKNFEKDNIPVIISILTDIAYHNSKTFIEISGILSTLLDKISSPETKSEIIRKIFKKLKKVTNTGYFEIWFQRVILKESELKLEFEEKLCKLVNGEKIELWNMEWINSIEIKNILKNMKIIDSTAIEESPTIIEYDEIKVFDIY